MCSTYGQRTVEIHVKLLEIIRVLVALFVEYTSSFPVCFTHEIILALTSETESFGCARVTAIPRLGSTTDDQDIVQLLSA